MKYGTVSNATPFSTASVHLALQSDEGTDVTPNVTVFQQDACRACRKVIPLRLCLCAHPITISIPEQEPTFRDDNNGWHKDQRPCTCQRAADATHRPIKA
ncbi:hypothetical protein, unlikely [Trypanosoma brucei gambiense DAL972]|uniref:Uncharacterized protein n=1 Tax=Trypanosoma brucei gambiense (strain MHOM/CI/86/DAL972) TaxID=679716 RepID=C9ZN18_TRYB9|nr:hypothetical protein, unlikely [Trypanosoma brucei gambiense DAL972]CBH10672.1 hypothetical protein, unlikely [Trypanosoma brucei gambiense DAL972]|eukprot:XP_011772960.1 hypothetical protein, unlikely [Trypanosoma brucei gambiense DAL972]